MKAYIYEQKRKDKGGYVVASFDLDFIEELKFSYCCSYNTETYSQKELLQNTCTDFRTIDLKIKGEEGVYIEIKNLIEEHFRPETNFISKSSHRHFIPHTCKCLYRNKECLLISLPPKEVERILNKTQKGIIMKGRLNVSS